MQQTFTPELLVKHLYNETTEQESISVKEALANDETLQQEYSLLQKAKYALDETGGETPGSSVIESILTFSKERELTETH